MNRLVFPPEFDSAQIARLLQRTTLALVVSLALPIICLAACVFFLVNAVGWVERSNRVIEQAHAIDKELVTMQTNFRGFRLTSDQTYADRFKSARQSLPQHLVLLETLVANSTKNRTEVSSLRAEIKTWLKYIDGEFLAGRDDPAVMRSPGSLRGAPLFDATQARLEGIIAGERRLQEQRNWKRQRRLASNFAAPANAFLPR